MGIPWSFKRNFTGAKEIKDTNDYLSRIGRAIGSLDSMPVGFNMPWWSDTLPSSKYMFMEGQPLANYPEAKAVFGDNLPDLRGRVMVHKSADTEFNAIKKTGGEKTHALTVDELANHNHTMHNPGNAGAGELGAGYGIVYSTYNRWPVYETGVQTSGEFTGWGLEAAGGGQAHNNLQPYIVCRYIAKVLP
jgi:microcystin-dependent protein